MIELGNRELYNYLKVLYNFDNGGYYEEDFMKSCFDMEQSLKDFKNLLKYMNIELNKQIICDIFIFELVLLNPILWKSVLNAMKFKGKVSEEFEDYKNELIYELTHLDGEIRYDSVNEILNKLVREFIFRTIGIENYLAISNWYDTESFILKDNKVYCVKENGVYKLVGKRLRNVLKFEDKKDWNEIYSYLDIHNCQAMCDEIKDEDM